ncbi:MAG TPA: hypothetical protein PLN06_09365 [Bacteroidales bacterium]|nr:hypothetical protein [Bacteroidales bacterium]HCI55036.1 hypothetical protein [Bacteroidales bacterium]HOU96813.1 hypothetical protein [Bacteroidales bacterium]HQG37369.1 hypothetical protein [Bacteroidales bacterium]HQG52006.1 hypothetical protein [Bacteroidales bacterium]
MKATEILGDIQNRWNNVYWFSRMLINNDKYVAIGKEPKLLSMLASSLRLVAKESKDKDTLTLQKQTLRNIIEERYKKTVSRDNRVQRMLAELDKEINTPEDMEVFILTCESIMLPLHQAISNIPGNDKEFTLNIAKSYLDIQGEAGLATVISLWDDLGVKGCLTAERTEIVRAFTTLRVLLTKDKSITEEERDIILTAFTQEFERRAAQKRKKRAGGSLEDVIDFILGYYKIKRAKAPSHFQADLEVDNWVKTKDGWLIGISCKRTIRERWKNVSSSTEVYNRFKVKYIFHVVTFDEDLSDEKLTLLGEQRQIFYLPDNSRRLKYASEHVGLKNYVRPISQFINDIRKEIK